MEVATRGGHEPCGAVEVVTLIVMLAPDGTANVTGANHLIAGGLIKTA
ncbi:MAG: hypothetical protein QOJ57_1497 [Thermoleophilaceae bacterium]|nr:hypothetical protein [Thermoleophilaceae bacterium]